MSVQFRIDVNSGIPYPVRQEVIDDLQDATAPCRPGPDMTSSPLIAGFVAFDLQPNTRWPRSRTEAVRRVLMTWRPKLYEPQTLFDVCFKAFHDFDLVFFGGVLSGRVHMRVEHVPGHIAWGVSCPRGAMNIERSTIALNSWYTNISRPATVHDLLAVQIHEMTHSFLHIKSFADEGVWPNEGHGESFQYIVRQIQGWLIRNHLYRDISR